MKPELRFLFNPVNWFRAWQFQRQQGKFDKSQYDLELYLYARLLKNDMLHYGYFDDAAIDGESISLRDMENAQVRYAEKIIEQVHTGPVLDIGCGMGGLSVLLHENGFSTDGLTPNVNQVRHIRKKYPQLNCYQSKFEDLPAEKKYGTLINAESLQYINLNSAFQQAGKLLSPGGRWIITDYFRINEDGINRSGHRLDEFLQKINTHGWTIHASEDMTPNILPTLQAIQVYTNRFLLPLKHYGEEKLRYKKAWLYFLSGPLRKMAEQKMDKELAAIDPNRFSREKKYMLFVLEKLP